MRGERRHLLPIRRQRQGRLKVLRPLNLLLQVGDDALTIVAAELRELHTQQKNGASFRFRPRFAVAHDPAGMNVSARQGKNEVMLATKFEREAQREQPSKHAEVHHTKLDLLSQLSRLTDKHARLLAALLGQAIPDVGADAVTLRRRKRYETLF